MVKVRLKKGDNVKIIAGKDKGKQGKVLFIDRDKNRAIVEGINIVMKHAKPSRTNQRGGIVSKESPIHVSNLMYMHHGKPTRIAYRLIEGDKGFTKQRVAVITGEVID
ncbi:MAG: 50S ribosomal protein L24 [Clostridiales bacterium]|jgi:large subunit ribosomal protein L24|nr:50S ribosomal protein L24 [Clostridiales bacterium]